jgi:hypothetical protein
LLYLPTIALIVALSCGLSPVQDGLVVESGRHDELATQGRLFSASFYRLQLEQQAPAMEP